MSRDRDSLRHQLANAGQRMSGVSAAHDALQQEMMELTQERRRVLTDRHVEVSDGYTHRRERAATEPKCTPCDNSLTNSYPRACPECPSAASFAAKEKWSDEIIKVPNGDACPNAEGEKCSPSQNRASVLGR